MAGRVKLLPLLLFASVALASPRVGGEPVNVRFIEGTAHAPLVLRDLNGMALADGDWTQTIDGARVTARLTFRFKDGSLHEETTVFSQRQQFRLMSDRLVQKGPTFAPPLEMSIDGTSGDVSVRYSAGGRQHTESQHIDVPADLSNGMIPTLLRNARPEAPPQSLSFAVAQPAPRVVTLAITRAGAERVMVGTAARRVTHYVLKVRIGGVSGLLAPVVGKQPPDSHVWILEDSPPTFLKSEQPLYVGGPVWRIELAGPVK